MELDYRFVPRRRGFFERVVIDHNPFYLLSALCMLGGCVLLTNSWSFSPVAAQRIVLLIAVLNVYELLLVGVAIWLIRMRGLVRDGMILLGIEAMFLADVAMLNSEVLSRDFRIGVLVNATVWLLAAVKITVVLRALSIRMVGAGLLILAHLAALAIVPAALKLISDQHGGRVPDVMMYGAWWTAAVLPVMTATWRRRDHAGGIVSARGVVLMYAGFALASLLLHLSLSHWVYKVQLVPADLAPLILGLGAAAGAWSRQAATSQGRAAAQFFVPLVALLFSQQTDSQLWMEHGRLIVTPMVLACLGAALVHAYGWWLHRHVVFGVGSCLLLSAGMIDASGMNAAQGAIATGNVARSTMQRVGEFLRDVLPSTSVGWGALSVLSSFVLLLAGAGVSAMTRRSEPPKDTA